MANRLGVLLRHDVRLQLRYNIFSAYLVVIVVTGAAVYFLKEIMPSWFLGLVVFTDNAAVGFFFLGGMILLERAENVRDTLAVTPVSASEYMLSKAIAFTALAILTVTVLALAIGKSVNWPLYLFAVTITSVFYLGLGAWISVRTKTVTGYITKSIGYFLPIMLPSLLALMEPMPLALGLIPTAAQFDLILAALDGTDLPSGRFLFLLLSATVGTAFAFWVGIRALRAELGEKQ